MAIRVTNKTRYTLADGNGRNWAPGESDVVNAESNAFGSTFHVSEVDDPDSSSDIVDHYLDVINDLDDDNAALNSENSALETEVAELKAQVADLERAAEVSADGETDDGDDTEAEINPHDESSDSSDTDADADLQSDTDDVTDDGTTGTDANEGESNGDSASVE